MCLLRTRNVNSKPNSNFCKKAAKLKGQRLAKFLASCKTKMKPNEIYTTNLITEAIKENPHADLKEILVAMFPKHIKKLEFQQKKVLNQMSIISEEFQEADKKLTKEFIQNGLKYIEERKGDKHFKRNKFITEFYFLKDKFQKKRIIMYKDIWF